MILKTLRISSHEDWVFSGEQQQQQQQGPLLLLTHLSHRQEVAALPAMWPAVWAHDDAAAAAAGVKVDSHEEHGGDADQGPREPGLLPANDAVPGQDHLAPALQLLLQLGRFLRLNTDTQTHNHTSCFRFVFFVFKNKILLECTVAE